MNPKRAAGVSYVEAVVGLILMGLTMGPLFMSFSTLNRGTTLSLNEMLASQYSSELLEQIRSLPVATIIEARGVSSLADLVTRVAVPVTGEKPVFKFPVLPGVFLLATSIPEKTFRKRELWFQKETRQAGGTKVNLLKATAYLEWEVPGREAPKHYTATTFVMEP